MLIDFAASSGLNVDRAMKDAGFHKKLAKGAVKRIPFTQFLNDSVPVKSCPVLFV